MKNTSAAPLSYVYDGRACLGFVLSRGRAGFEAFDIEERSLGVYATTRGRCCHHAGIAMSEGIFSKWQPRYAEHGIATFPVRIEGKDKRPMNQGYQRTGLRGNNL